MVSDSRSEYVRSELEAAVAGIPERVYEEPKLLATDLIKLAEDTHALYMRVRDFVAAAGTYVRTRDSQVEFLGGILKHVRVMYEALDEMKKLLDSGQKPVSLRSLIESLMATKMFIENAMTGKPCVIEAHGKRFVAAGSVRPTIPNPDKEPQAWAEFCEFLTKTGRPDLLKVGRDVSWRELQAHLEQLQADPTRVADPWPESLRVATIPTIRISDIK